MIISIISKQALKFIHQSLHKVTAGYNLNQEAKRLQMSWSYRYDMNTHSFMEKETNTH